MKKRIISTILVSAMLISLLVGCADSNGNVDAPPNDNTPSNGTSTPDTSPPDVVATGDLERVDLIFYVMGDPPGDQQVVEDAINEKLLERLNTTITFRFSTWTDFQQKYVNELTIGDVDLIYTANWLDYGIFAHAGAFLELDDLLDSYAPALKAEVGHDMLNMMRVGGDIFAIPNLWPEYVPLGIDYREDLRQRFNLPRPNSLENMETFFQGVMDNMPDQQILRPTADDMGTSLADAFDTGHLFLIKYPWVSPDMPYGLKANNDTPAVIYDYWWSQDFVDDMKLMKHWADLGFWSRSAIGDTRDDDTYKNGLAIALISGQNPNKHTTNVDDFADLNPDWISEYIAYGEITGAMYPAHATQNATAIVRGSRNPERAIMVLEYIMTDAELNKLVQCGIEGVHYNMVDGFYVNISDAFPYEAFNTWNLRVDEFKLPQLSDKLLDEMFARYDEIAAQTRFPRVNIFGGFSENYENYQVERIAIRNVMTQFLLPLQAGLVDDVEAAVDEFRSALQTAGIDKARDGFREQWLAYCEEFGYN